MKSIVWYKKGKAQITKNHKYQMGSIITHQTKSQKIINTKSK